MKTNTTPAHDSNNLPDGSRLKTRRLIVISVIIFLAALGVRLLAWQDARLLEAGKVQSSVTSDYKRVAQLLTEGGVSGFVSSSSPLSNPDNLGHPPGYSILIATIYKLTNHSDANIQLVQISCDALAAVVLFLIIAELLPLSTATIAGLLSAFSPQFSWNSVLLLPDTLAVLPILLAIYCLALAYKRPRLGLIIAAGALVGLSCWLRANAMLLPFFLAALVFFLFERQIRLRYSIALVCGALLIILPLTIRNAVVFGHFIPVSLGAGQTFLEGIADYDKGQRFDLPNTDLGIMHQEADAFNRPDYRETLFGPDGVKRERMRLTRGFGMVSSRPLWFFGVMVRRAGGMLKLERTRLVSADPPVTNSLTLAETTEPFRTEAPADLLTTGAVLSPNATAIVSTDAQAVIITGDDSRYGKQFATAPIRLEKNMDYSWRIPITLEQGRIKLGVESTDQSGVYAATIVDTVEGKSGGKQPTQNVELPFVSGNDNYVQLILANEGADAPAVIHLGTVKLFQLGPASFVWTRYPRILIRGMQKVFLTAVMLPLALIGVALTAMKRRWHVLAILLIVPAYYLSVQSATHTEYRYILAVYHFLFAFSAVTLSWIGAGLWRKLRTQFRPRAL
ncbi:MAG: glycosyltransferase family 39 protein [Pyrinomonadaceae bacterium]|nr:glycosyltransferase family 39 protein [Pyrinomonadaceae bacterium]